MMIAIAEYSVECNILALIYINRITANHQFPLTMRNWRGIWVAAIIIAQKVWDDHHLKTSSFVRILPNVTKEQLKDIEMLAFSLLDFNTIVKPSVYAKYYFELRQLFKDIVGSREADYKFQLEPLSIAEAKRLEYRTQLRGQSSNNNTTSSSTSSSKGVSQMHTPMTGKDSLLSPPNTANLLLTPNGYKQRFKDDADPDDLKRHNRYVLS
jgi:hypothetical protein